jgi:hypothetical protein
VTTQAKATFSIKSWDEKTWEGKPIREVPGVKLSHAVVTRSYQGDIEGEGTIQYLMSYNEDGSASYVALERVTARIKGRSGSFVLQHTGTFSDGAARSTSTVVAGSGTGELRGLRGRGSEVAVGDQAPYPFTLDYDFT